MCGDDHRLPDLRKPSTRSCNPTGDVGCGYPAIATLRSRARGVDSSRGARRHPATSSTVVLPDIQDVVGSLPRDLADDEDELLARVRLDVPEHPRHGADRRSRAAIAVLRARAAGNATANPFGPRMKASSLRGSGRRRAPGARRGTTRPRDRPRAPVRVGQHRRDAGSAADPVPRAQRGDPSGDLGARHGRDPATGPRPRGLRRARSVARADDRDVVAGGRRGLPSDRT